MFTFIHTFTPESWEVLNKSGLFREGDGLKIMHKPYLSEDISFNKAANEESKLFKILSEIKCPFYIDRLQGGIPLPNWYEYDKNLLAKYKNVLGENFWGFQMHEWASNYRSDCRRIDLFYEKIGFDKSEKEKRKEAWKILKDNNLIVDKHTQNVYSGEKLLLEAYTPEEWADAVDPKSTDELLTELNKLYKKRVDYTENLLFPANSHFMASRIEIANGAKRLMPEVGWQISDMRIQMAYTRGMAKWASIPWGIYYECWCDTEGYGLTIPFSLRKGQDEWHENQLTRGSGADKCTEERVNGGSSRSLQERAWRYAYFSGASFMGEEYGVCNTFYDYDSTELSPYGKVKYDFLKFTEKYPDLGKTYTPFAIVLPADMPILEINFSDKYLGFDYKNTEHLIYLRKTLSEIFGHDGAYGNQSHVLKDGKYPDVFDIIHEDQDDAIKNYEYLIDLTGDENLSKKYNNIVKLSEIDDILSRILPIKVEGDIHAIYNKTENGIIALIINNDGVVYNNFKGDIFIPEATKQAEIICKQNIEIIEKSSNVVFEKTGNGYNLTLGAGQWIMIKI